MSGWFVIAANLAAVANAADGDSRRWFPDATFPEWAQMVLAFATLIAGIVIARAAGTIAEKLPKAKDGKAKEFTRMLCDQVWRHTDAVSSRFAAHLRNDPNDLTTLHVMLRNLREELAAPIHFIDQMLAQPPSSWPNYALLGAFSNWAGQLKSMATQLAEHQAALIYPPGKDAADKYRDQMLVYKFLTERTVLSRGISQLRSNAFAFCAAAAKSLEKAKKPKPGHETEEEEEEAHRECPCCRKRDEHVLIKPGDPLELPPLPLPPEPPAKPAPAKTCVCIVPAACHCSRACACACQCPPAPPPAPA